jgi:hypothetical protein
MSEDSQDEEEQKLIALQDALESSPLYAGVYTPTSQEDFILFYSGKNHPQCVANDCLHIHTLTVPSKAYKLVKC